MRNRIQDDTRQRQHIDLLRSLDPQLAVADREERDPPAWGSDPFDALAQLEEEMGEPLNKQ